MNPVDFIRKNITASLVAEGFPPSVIEGGVVEGLDHYRRMSQASKKGSAFDDCLYHAKAWAQGQSGKSERKATKKQRQGTLL